MSLNLRNWGDSGFFHLQSGLSYSEFFLSHLKEDLRWVREPRTLTLSPTMATVVET